MLFGYSASAVGVIYNTTIYPELNADWADLADSQYADDIAIPDPEKSGACKDFLAGLVTGLGQRRGDHAVLGGQRPDGARRQCGRAGSCPPPVRRAS